MELGKGWVSFKGVYLSLWAAQNVKSSDAEGEWIIKLPTGESEVVKLSSRELPRAHKRKGFPPILPGRLTDNLLQRIDGHISKHCSVEGLGCGNRS